MTTLQREALTPIRRRPFDEFGNVSYNNYGGEASSIMDYIMQTAGSNRRLQSAQQIVRRQIRFRFAVITELQYR